MATFQTRIDMAASTSERMARYRERQRQSGMTTLTLVVPATDAALFQQFAAERRKRFTESAPQRGKGAKHEWFTLLDSLGSSAQATRQPKGKRSTRATNRAEALADTLIRKIIKLGWPAGMPLGSEAELMKTHGVSRTVLRQAVRLLEHHSIARMRRGASGGLVVAQPDPGATMRAVRVYLEYRGIKPSDILETRRTLELAAVELAIANLDESGARRLAEIIAAEAALDGSASAEEPQRFHVALGELSGDPALALFGGIVLQLTDDHSSFSRRPKDERDAVIARIKRFHKEIAHAIMAKDAVRATRKMGRYLEGLKSWME